MRVFLDTNVLAAAFTTRGLCADVVRYILAEHQMVVGEVVIAELQRVLTDRFKLPRSTTKDILDLLRRQDVIPKPASIALRDPDDAWILSSAIDGRCEVLVTGDGDLLAVADRAPLTIVNPRGFWDFVRKDRTRSSAARPRTACGPRTCRSRRIR